MRTHGSLKKWNDERGFGFIASPQHTDEIFVHISAFPNDGVRPQTGELISFELQTDAKGKKRAVRVQRPGTRKRAGARRSDTDRNSGVGASPLLGIAVVVILAAGYMGYDRFFKEGGATASAGTEESADAEYYSRFQCDGRQYCSQMQSRAEAEFFVKYCPDTKMDGDGDGIPCEGDSRF